MRLPAVELHDVRDAEGFVAAAVADVLARHGVRLSFHDREDLEAHGLSIMCELAAKYRPAHGARREDWRTFSGYAHEMLPKRLLDELRKRGTRTRDPVTGRRGWVPRAPVASLERLRESPGFDEARVVPMTRFVRPPTGPSDRLAA